MVRFLILLLFALAGFASAQIVAKVVAINGKCFCPKRWQIYIVVKWI
ncbi:MAG: hypothetical protein PHN38_08700 [Sulfurospirillaceae bacterium]|nr:hypothetical protein [Sulfurospirillaceae bacterium]